MNAPTLHLGGTSFKDLFEQHTDAIVALGFARDKLVEAGPHPRDFIRRDAGYQAAIRMHSARVGLITEMIKELERIREDICKQNDERQAMKGEK